jgi:hypothetical protein
MKIRAILATIVLCSVLQAAQFDNSAYADLGRRSRYTETTGQVTFAEEKSGLSITDTLRLQPNHSYEVYVLTEKCSASAPLNAAQEKMLQQSMSKGRKILSVDGKGKKTPAPTTGMTIKTIMSKGLLLNRDGKPIDCEDIAPTSFGPPPALKD